MADRKPQILDLGIAVLPVDVGPPTLEVVSPSPGQPLLSTTPLVIRIQATAGLAFYAVTVLQLAADGSVAIEEAVCINGRFAAHYDAGSSVLSIDGLGGVQLTMVRTGGWKGSPQLKVEAVTNEGVKL